LSTLSQPHLTPQWKEEVNRRIAAHKSRKAGSPDQDSAEPQSSPATSRAAQAAARVAARYAKAPTYSQMQAEEARVAVRAAEIATMVALDAQAVAESALAELHAAANEQPRRPAVVENIAQALPRRQQEPAQVQQARVDMQPAVPAQNRIPAPPRVEERIDQPQPQPSAASAAVHPQPEPVPVEAARDPQFFAIRWDPDMPVRRTERAPGPPRVHEDFELSVEDWWVPSEVGENLRAKPITIDPEPAHANLIQFPRELVATRKMRPRLAEIQAGVTEAEGQLSIFEVDPGSISTAVDVIAADEGQAAHALPEWSGMRLDAQPYEEPRYAAKSDPAAKSTHLAPVGLRLMANVVDGALILASFIASGFIAAANFQHPPTGKTGELVGVVALAIISMLYYAAFFSMGMSTPGMKYAGIGLCTFDDQSPTRAQLRRRLGAMVLSLLPVGLGVVWSVFDEEHLTWHDRYSQTYLRKC
jgi:uncharacterized RDD family membrane protein YckC